MCESEVINASVVGGAWRRVTAFLVLNFFGFCRSKAIENHGIVSFLKLWADLHRFEGLGHGLFKRSWLRLGARGSTFGPEIFRFCRSESDGSSRGTGFVKIFLRFVQI